MTMRDLFLRLLGGEWSAVFNLSPMDFLALIVIALAALWACFMVAYLVLAASGK